MTPARSIQIGLAILIQNRGGFLILAIVVAFISAIGASGGRSRIGFPTSASTGIPASTRAASIATMFDFCAWAFLHALKSGAFLWRKTVVNFGSLSAVLIAAHDLSPLMELPM